MRITLVTGGRPVVIDAADSKTATNALRCVAIHALGSGKRRGRRMSVKHGRRDSRRRKAGHEGDVAGDVDHGNFNSFVEHAQRGRQTGHGVEILEVRAQNAGGCGDGGYFLAGVRGEDEGFCRRLGADIHYRVAGLVHGPAGAGNGVDNK